MQRQNEGHLPPFPVWDDVRTFDGRAWRGFVDVVSGGFPCQAHSGAARGRTVADDLWPEMRRVVADAAPRFVFAENVVRKAIDHAAEDLEAMGYRTRCIALAASDLGADHIRQRYWLLAYTDDDSELLLPVDAEVAGCREFTRVFGQPSPTNHEWLMAWPIGWTDSLPLATDRFQSWRRLHGKC